MANLNKVFLIGNLTRDPELRYLPSGTAVTTFTVAVNRTYLLQSGEKKEEVSFMPVVVWARRAETCAEYLNKGSAVFVEGRLRSRSWQGQDGQKRSTIEIIALSVQFLSRTKKDMSKQPLQEGAQPPFDMPHEADTIPAADVQEGSHEEDEVPF